jgi:hypothetical protein
LAYISQEVRTMATDHFINLTIITIGDDLEERFNVNQPLQAIKARALPQGANPNNFDLEYNDQPLDTTKKIEFYVEQFGWTDGTILELEPKPEPLHA